ncbi:MAG: hypothetical protein FWF95_00075 [Syntrophorhabdaceae bacterium]|nr:hypothetical protein [Syntrophorhabdaceae bacterium]
MSFFAESNIRSCESRLMPALLSGLLLAAVFFFPCIATGGETIVYNDEPAKLDDPLIYFPNATAANTQPQVNALFPKTDSSNNTVIFNSGNIYIPTPPLIDTRTSPAGNVYGGIGDLTNVEYNRVSITGGQVYDVYGGFSAFVDVNNNKVEIENAMVRNSVYGGRVVRGSNVTGDSNSVSIGHGAVIHNNVYGAYATVPGAFRGNSIEISGGEVQGQIISGAYGFASGVTVSGNSVTINNESKIVNANIYGGRGQSGAGNPSSIFGNSVIINGGEINLGHPGRAIYGGENITGNASTVYENRVIVNGGTIQADVYGAKISLGSNDTERNSVSLNSGSITGNIYGGDVVTGTARGNIVNIAGAAVTGDVYGGYTTSTGNITANTVTLSSGSITGNIYGGGVSTGTAQSNIVNIADTAVTGNVYGGYTTSTGNVLNNAVNLSGGSVTGTVFGTNLASWSTTGNSLTALGGLTNVGGVQNFQYAAVNNGATLNVTNDVGHAATFLNLTNNGLLSFYNGAATNEAAHIMGDYSGNGQIGLDVLFDTQLADTLLFDTAPGSPVLLALKPEGAPDLAAQIKIAEVSSGASNDLFTTSDPGYGIYSYEIERVGNEYFLGISEAHTGNMGKVYSEAAAAGLAQLAMFSETFLRNSMETAVSATEGRGFGISGTLSYSSQRIDTGSYADLKGGSGMLTLSYHKNGSPISLGVFTELFIGSYKTRNSVNLPSGSFNIRSSGDLESYGGGVFIQYRKRLAQAIESGAFTNWIPGPHIEALARTGYSMMSFETDSLSSRFSKKGRAYHGVSLGGGHVFEPAPRFTVDLYGYGMWVRMNDRNVTDSLGQRIEFEAAHSLRIVSGFRAGYEASERVRPYVGIAADWETMGKPNVSIDGYQANRADMSGFSALAEAGVGYKSGSNIFIDIKAAGSLGVRDGIGGMAEVKYRF